MARTFCAHLRATFAGAEFSLNIFYDFAFYIKSFSSGSFSEIVEAFSGMHPDE